MHLERLPPGFATTRTTLHRVATHVLGRRRHVLSGRFGLRSTPGGFGTLAAGPEHEVVRLRGTRLIREMTGERPVTTTLALVGSTLATAADHVDVELDTSFEVGRDTPPVGDPAAPLVVDADAARLLADWFAFAWAVLDAVLATLGPAGEPSVVQLWPEHFDAGCDVLAAPGERANLGASPGDAYDEEPYLYVGPWSPARPGDGTFWNAPFGAALTWRELGAAEDPVAAAVDFCLRGLGRFGR